MKVRQWLGFGEEVEQSSGAARVEVGRACGERL
jgi:hypothetical protein